MFRRTGLLGTACIAAAALAAGPAVADTLQGFEGFADATYQNTSFNDCSGCDNLNTATLGIGGALPIADIPNLNVQLEGSYGHNWLDGFSQEDWNFGFSPFLAYAGSRWGVNFNYLTETHFGHVTNGGVFMEWYLMDTVTLMLKGGYLSAGGRPLSGHGHYVGAGVAFYAMPDLAITGSVDWTDLTTSGSLATGICPQCRLGVSNVKFAIDGEFLASEDYGVSIFAGFAYNQEDAYTFDDNFYTFKVGLRWYTGMGPLVDRHRNGTLNRFLVGS